MGKLSPTNRKGLSGARTSQLLGSSNRSICRVAANRPRRPQANPPRPRDHGCLLLRINKVTVWETPTPTAKPHLKGPWESAGGRRASQVAGRRGVPGYRVGRRLVITVRTVQEGLPPRGWGWRCAAGARPAPRIPGAGKPIVQIEAALGWALASLCPSTSDGEDHAGTSLCLPRGPEATG